MVVVGPALCLETLMTTSAVKILQLSQQGSWIWRLDLDLTVFEIELDLYLRFGP